jgi:hypothetical protein
MTKLLIVIAAAVLVVCSPLGLVMLAGTAQAEGGATCDALLAGTAVSTDTGSPSPGGSTAPVVPPAPLASPVGLKPTSAPTDAAGQLCDDGDGMVDVEPGDLPAGYTLPTDAQQAKVVAYALAQLGKPYVFGAAGPAAFDCSGLVMMAWRQVGVFLIHSTRSQIHEGVRITSIEQMQPGDLIFIPGSDGTRADPGHVGMYIGRDGNGNQILVQAPHTGTTVRVTKVSAWSRQIVAIVRPTMPPL